MRQIIAMKAHSFVFSVAKHTTIVRRLLLWTGKKNPFLIQEPGIQQVGQ